MIASSWWTSDTYNQKILGINYGGVKWHQLVLPDQWIGALGA